jgi:hypothetical protein
MKMVAHPNPSWSRLGFAWRVRSATTDANGTAVLNFKANTNKDGSGTYDVTATASKPGYTDGFASTIFGAN